MTRFSLCCILCLSLLSQSIAQILGRNHYGSDNSIAMQQLSLNRSSIAGGIGEIGVVSSDHYHEIGLTQNPALLSRGTINRSVHATYTPWLRALVSDADNINVSICYSIDSSSAFGFTVDYFKLGSILTTALPNPYHEEFNIQDYYIDLRWAGSLGTDISGGMYVKYLASDPGRTSLTTSSGQVVDIQPIEGFSTGMGIEHHREYGLYSDLRFRWANGISIEDIGSTTSYYPDSNTMRIPASVNIGSIVTLKDVHVGKMKYYILEIDLGYQASHIFVPFSFNTLKEKSIIHQIGFEIRILRYKYHIAVRTGAFIEHELNGGRKYQTFGLGLRSRKYGLNASFIRPYATRHPLEDTFRYSASYHF